MARLHKDFQAGVLTSSPGSGTTTMTSAGFATLPEVASPDYLMLVLDPLAVAGNPEIVQVTAHAPGATTVTVSRGEDGTTARGHTAGVTAWLHGPVASDLGPEWSELQQFDAGVQIGSDTHSLQITDTLGTNGRRVSIQPPDALASTKSSQMELVPGSLIDPAAHCTTQILLYNQAGADYERFTFSCVNDQYLIESTYNGVGTAKNIYFTMGGSVGNAITGRNALEIVSDASVILNGASYTSEGKSWGGERTTIGDFTDTGASRLIIDTRTANPASNTGDHSAVEFRRGGTRKWAAGLNYAGDDIDAFDFYSNTAIAFQLRQDGNIADTETAIMVRRNVGGTLSLQRVTMGAADSGGTGFKVLRVAN